MKLKYEVSRYEVTVPGFKPGAGLRLALIADLHNNVRPGLTEKVAEAAPDAVVIAGDMVNGPVKSSLPRFGRAYGLVKDLAELFPVYYSPGNHEARWKRAEAGSDSLYAAYRRGLEAKGVVFLDNETIPLDCEAGRIVLAGLDLPKRFYPYRPGRFDGPTAEEMREMLGEKPEDFTVLLAHSPLYFDSYAAWGADLVLSGHVHGGMLRLPGLGGVFGPGFNLFPPYTKGLYEKDGRSMLVSAGVGTHSIPIRVNDPRQIILADLIGSRPERL